MRRLLAGLGVVAAVGSLVVFAGTSANAFAPAPIPVGMPSGTLAALGLGGGDAAAATAVGTGAAATGADAAATVLAASAAAAPETLGISLALGAAAAGGIYMVSQMSPGFNPDADVSVSYGPNWTIFEAWESGPGTNVRMFITYNGPGTVQLRVRASCNNGDAWAYGPVAVPSGSPIGTYYACTYHDGIPLSSFSLPQLWVTDATTHVETPVPTTGASPARTLGATVHCVQVGGSGTTDVVTTSASFHEAANSVSPHLGIGNCPTGYVPEGLSVGESGGPSVKPIGTTAQPGIATLYNTYPDCVSSRCLLELYRLDPASGTKTSCFDAPGRCLDWASDPNRATNYECDYGTHVLALQDCVVYLRYWVSTGTPTYTDPGTVLPPAPSAGASPVPLPGDACASPSVLGLLTGAFFVEGAKCVLLWAFVPSGAEVQADFGSVRTAWSATVVGKFFGTWSDTFAAATSLPLASDCLGPSVGPFTIPYGATPKTLGPFHPVQACTDPAKWIHDWWMPISTGIVYVGGFLAVGKVLGRMVGLDVPVDESVPGAV